MIPTTWTVMGVALFVLLVNVPLGRLRAGARKYTWRNFGCILAPVPMVVTIRLTLGLSIKVAPVFLLAAIAGQRLGLWTATRGRKMVSDPVFSERDCNEEQM